MILLHDLTQDYYLTAGILDGTNHVTAIQGYKCRRCGETIALPDCRKNMCKIFMSLGCKNVMPKKVKWQAPMKERKDVDKKDYPAKRRTHGKAT